MKPAADQPAVSIQTLSLKSAFLGFVISNFVMTAALVLLGSVAG